MAEREFAAKVEELDNVIAFVEEELEKLECPMKVVMQIDIAVEELFVNIAHYAYGEGSGNMQLSIQRCNGSVSISLKDNGTPFNPLEKGDPDINLGAEDRNIGGLGIFMVKKSMDKVEYKYENSQNILTITKNI